MALLAALPGFLRAAEKSSLTSTPSGILLGAGGTVETLIDEKIRLINDMDPNPQKI